MSARELVIVLTLDCVRERGKLAWGCDVEDERSRELFILLLTHR